MKLNKTVSLEPVNLRRLLYTRRFLVLGVVAMVLAVGVVLFAIVPQIQRLTEVTTVLQSENDVLTKLRTKVNSLSQTQYLEGFQEKDRVDLALPSQKPLLQLLNTTNTLAQQAGVTISEVETAPGRLATGSAQTNGTAANAGGSPAASPSPGNQAAQARQRRGPKDTEVLDIAVKISGTLEQINRFVDLMERATPLVDISEIKLASDDLLNRQSQAGIFRAELLLTTYYFTKALKVTIDEPLPNITPAEQTFLGELDTLIYPQLQQQQQIQNGGLQDLFGVNDQGERQ